ncbi:MAG: hypothetical protein ATN31_03495 [Candidatus Epulonipiscioides saccharophilum]|nr:MAG: hypothetical protein ATN31_03495 [Epulopiscium sp. AS2M-Bin001]
MNVKDNEMKRSKDINSNKNTKSEPEAITMISDLNENLKGEKIWILDDMDTERMKDVISEAIEEFNLEFICTDINSNPNPGFSNT